MAVGSSEMNSRSGNEIHHTVTLVLAFSKAQLSFPILFEELAMWICTVPNIATGIIALGSLRRCQCRGGGSKRRWQYCRGFIAPLPTKNNNILGLNVQCAIRNRYKLVQIKSAVVNSCMYVVDTVKGADRSVSAIGNLIPNRQNSRTRWRCIFKGLSQHGGRADFSKSLRENSLMMTYRMNLIRGAGSIALNRTFKTVNSLHMTETNKAASQQGVKKVYTMYKGYFRWPGVGYLPMKVSVYNTRTHV